MASADDLRRLAEEMAGAYEERVRVISDVKQATADIKKETGQLLNDFGKVHAAMSKELKAELAGFKTDLDAAEGERKKDDQAEISERKDYIMDLKNKARELIDEFDKAHGDMAQTLRAELAGFKADLDVAGSERKKDDQAEISERKDYIMDLKNKARELIDEFDKAHGDMAQALRAELARFKSELDAEEDERKKRDQGETRETAEAWKGLLSAMQAARGRAVVAGPVEVEAKVEVKTVEEIIEEPVKEAEEVEEAAAEVEEEEAIEKVAADEEDLGGRILDLLDDNPEGLKMTRIADMLGVENWRTLIPVMRELQDDGEIRKEDTLYFLPE